MTFVPFELERWQSAWENRVRINLSESGVHPLTIAELLALSGGDHGELERLPLGYSQSNGTDELRAAIAALYPGATPDHVLVTTGSAEANFVACWSLLQPGDRAAILVPTYMQTWGLAQNFGARVATFSLRPERGWEPDPDEVRSAIAPGTKLVVVTNPNNPTGHILSDAAREMILERVRASGAWLLCDEVYQGAEREAGETETLWGAYEKTLVTNGLSKAYGLPGLRIGWAVAPPKLIEELMSYHDYLTLTPTMLSDRLARFVLEKRKRQEVLGRTRSILRKNYPAIRDWIEDHGSLFAHVPPAAGAICYIRYAMKMNSTELVERLRKEKSTLLVPGDMFGMDGYVRIGIGPPTDYLLAGLDRFDVLLRELKAGRAR